jgi:aminopeptidase N
MLLSGAAAGTAGADVYARQPSIDAVHYEIAIELGDGSDAVSCITRVHVLAREDGMRSLWLDLDEMTVDAVTLAGRPLAFQHRDGRLSIELDRPYARHEIAVVEVRHHGSPVKGLLIGRNAHGRPVTFAENWPDRARYWFPSIDHPSDKATLELSVTAPERHDVVGPGRLVETRSLLDGRRLTRWSQGVAIPTYCMVFGAAEFSIRSAGEALGVPLSVYAYPKDAEIAARRFRRAALTVRYMSETVGPYPYEKLAQVESTTRIGGMENASAIFYAEPGFQKPLVTESPMAHEIAHQWFGDSVTPADWDHIWVSEGFATYFDALFYEHLEGVAALRRRMADAAIKLKEYHRKRQAPIVDPGVTDPSQKLNPLSYEKGAWVLHMLRRRLGDDVFFAGIRRYYSLYAGGTATTEDFQRVMESASETSLATFFRHWLYQVGWPELDLSWRFDARRREVEITVEQTQASDPFETPVELVFHGPDVREPRTVQVSGRRQTVTVPLPFRPTRVEIDPDGWLLHSATVRAR